MSERDQNPVDDAPETPAPRNRKKRRPQPRPAGAVTTRPLVAVVGRPNVGKSTLFNRLARARIAVVEDTPGVTRDRHYADAEAMGVPYAMVDTGGFDPESEDPMQSGITGHVRAALDEADLVLCVLDASGEPLQADRDAVQLLRQAELPVIYVANKCDSPKRAHEASDFYALGLASFLPVSALHGHGVGDLEAAIADALPESKLVEPTEHEGAPRLAIVGRPNAGKSSLVNRLCGEDRQLVDDRPGTTVDSIDTIVTRGESSYVLIDTAGIRRKRAKKQSVEALGIWQAIRAVERCDAVVLMIDAREGPAEQDAKIAGLANDRGRAIVVALNKTDLLDRDERKAAVERARDILSFIPWVPIVQLSAMEGRGLGKLLQTVDVGIEGHRKRVTTSDLNRFFEEVLEHHPPPPQGNRAVRLYYVTQAQTAPPSFVAMCNEPDHVHFSYRRYVANQIRKRFDFKGTPVRVFYRRKKDKRRGKK